MRQVHLQLLYLLLQLLQLVLLSCQGSLLGPLLEDLHWPGELLCCLVHRLHGHHLLGHHPGHHVGRHRGKEVLLSPTLPSL